MFCKLNATFNDNKNNKANAMKFSKRQRMHLYSLGVCLLIVCISTQLHSCLGIFNDTEPDIDTFYLDQEFLDYTYLKPGHYWVYENAETGEVDSTYAYAHSVMKGEKASFRKPDGGGALIEATRIESRHVNYFLKGKLYLGKWMIRDDPTNDNFGDASVYLLKDLQTSMEIDYLKKNHTRGWNSSTDTFNGINIELNKKIKINNVTYYDVVTIELTPNTNTNKHVYKSYYARRLGAVRREFADGSIWDLIRYGKF